MPRLRRRNLIRLHEHLRTDRRPMTAVGIITVSYPVMRLFNRSLVPEARPTKSRKTPIESLAMQTIPRDRTHIEACSTMNLAKRCSQ